MIKLDNFEMNFNKFPEMKKFLDEMEADSRWEIVSAKKIRTKEAKKINPAQYTDLHDLELYTDTCENSGIYQCLKASGSDIPVRNTAMKTIYQRNRFGGSVFRDVTKAELAREINTFAKYAKGDTLVRIMGGKISAELSSSYVIIPMNEVFDTANTSFINQFTDVEFQGGYFDYILTTAKWLIRDKRISDAYSNIIGDNAKDIGCIVKVNTSDTGYSGANIFYQLINGNRKVYLSGELRMEHENKPGRRSIQPGIAGFKDNTERILGKFQESLMDLSKLFNIRIANPENCMTAVMKKAGISTKLIGDTVEFRKMTVAPGATNAMELYFDICQCVDIAISNGMQNSRHISDLEEKVASCLFSKWEKYDISSVIQISA